MFDVEFYLQRLGYSGALDPTVELLRSLHKSHLMSVPFDNSRYAEKGLRAWSEVDGDVNVFFDTLLREGKGGVCHELNGTFRRLLQELGFDTMIMAAGVRGPGGDFGPDLEHMFIGVRLEGQLWLADVGFAGVSFAEPVRLTEEVQHQYGCQYRVVEQEEYRVLQYKAQTGDWRDIYRFKLQPRELAEFKAMANLAEGDPGFNWAGEVITVGTIVRSRVFDTGKVLLIGRRYLSIDDGHEEIRVLVKPEQYSDAVDRVLQPHG